MRTCLFLLAWLPLISSYADAQSGIDVSGKVTDALNGGPLANCNVFINGSSSGTMTDSNGGFTLTGLPSGKYKLIISSVGYETQTLDLVADRAPLAFAISLKRKITELSAVTVAPFVQDGWGLYGKLFLDNFIGTTRNAADCRVLNEAAIHFRFSQKDNLLTVVCDEPIQIENRALGYVLSYQLDWFSFDGNDSAFHYMGYSYFKELPAKDERTRQRWAENRRNAYESSIMHFMRSLYGQRVVEEAFAVRRVGAGRKVPLVADSLVTIQPDGSRTLSFPGELEVIYGKKLRRTPQTESVIRLANGNPVVIAENGSYWPPMEIFATGFWAQSEKMANLLPVDYRVPVD